MFITPSRNWVYKMAIDLLDNDQGVIFYHVSAGEKLKVLFAGNNQVCLDWARLPRDTFFEIYSKKGRAERSCRVAEKYLAEKAFSMGQKKVRNPLNLKVVK